MDAVHDRVDVRIGAKVIISKHAVWLSIKLEFQRHLFNVATPVRHSDLTCGQIAKLAAMPATPRSDQTRGGQEALAGVL